MALKLRPHFHSLIHSLEIPHTCMYELRIIFSDYVFIWWKYFPFAQLITQLVQSHFMSRNIWRKKLPINHKVGENKDGRKFSIRVKKKENVVRTYSLNTSGTRYLIISQQTNEWLLVQPLAPCTDGLTTHFDFQIKLHFHQR